MSRLSELNEARKGRSAPSGAQSDALDSVYGDGAEMAGMGCGIATHSPENFNTWLRSSPPEARITPPRAPCDLLSSGNTAVGGVPSNVRPDCTGFPQF